MSLMSEVLLQLNGVSKTYPGVKACDSITLGIMPGEVHGLVGENGAGKSTLIKILAGVEQPDHGSEITMNGVSTSHFVDALDSAKRGIGVIFQDFSLFPNLSVAENIGFSTALEEQQRVVRWRGIKDRARTALREVGASDIDVDSSLESLSIAKQQLVAIARAVVLDAKLIIMDEPTSTLTSGEVAHLFAIIEGLKTRGISTVFVSHKLDEVFAVSDRVTVLRDGKLVGTYLKDDLDERRLVSLMVGREVHFTKRAAVPPGEVLLDVRAISKRGYFRDISFRLHKNEILGLTGLVGSGRTEVAKALFGLNVPDSGEVYVRGNRMKAWSPEASMELGISYVPENRQQEGLVMSQSLKTNMSLAVLKRLTSRLGFIDSRRETSLAAEQVKALDIRAYSTDMLVSNLSGGNQQKVVVGKWLATKPAVLIVDEPTNGVDVGAKSEIHRLLQELASEGMGILMVSSELPEILAVCDRILVMRRGRISAEFEAGECSQEAIMSSAVPTTSRQGDADGQVCRVR